MSETITCLIIDDEPIAMSLIEKYVNRFPELKLVGKCDDPIEGLESIREHNPQLLFLDIEMPEMSGLDMLDLLRAKRPMVILTSSSSAYAIRGYDYDVADYLIKPIPFDKFVQALDKVKNRLHIHCGTEGVDNVEEETAQSIFVKSDKIVHRINFNEIIYVEALKDYLKIYIKDFPKKFLVIRYTMQEIENQLPNTSFLRIHRSYIINLSEVDYIDGNQVFLKGSTELSIGIKYKDEVKTIIKTMMIG